MLKFLLDTNICIYITKNKPERVREYFNLHQNQICINSVVLMELLFGAEKSNFPADNRLVVEAFTQNLQILNYDSRAAEHTAEIRAELERNGNKIGAYDNMIAGHARSLGLVVVTNNEKEFNRVSGLRIENWAK